MRSLRGLDDVCRIIALKACFDAMIALGMFLVALYTSPFTAIAATAGFGMSLPGDGFAG